MPDGSAQITLAPPTCAAALPSIETLGRILRVQGAAYASLSERKCEVPESFRQRDAIHLLADRDYALADLILALPARTMADAVVQVAEALAVADRENTDAWEPELKQRFLQILRALASVLPVLVQASGVPPEELIEASYLLRQREDHFGMAERTLAECGA